MQETIQQVLKDLAKKRPAFYSEADFQLAFAWGLKESFASQMKAYDIYLERRFVIDVEDEESGKTTQKDCYVDVCIESEHELYLIELKYKTIGERVVLSTALTNEEVLKNQAANDLGRYGYLKDIWRIEQVFKKIGGQKKMQGFAIILTNDKKYYEEPKVALNTIDRTFRIHERSKIINPFVNPIDWTYSPKNKTFLNKYPGFTLAHIPFFDWQLYSQQKDCTFKYLLTTIN